MVQWILNIRECPKVWSFHMEHATLLVNHRYIVVQYQQSITWLPVFHVVIHQYFPQKFHTQSSINFIASHPFIVSSSLAVSYISSLLALSFLLKYFRPLQCFSDQLMSLRISLKRCRMRRQTSIFGRWSACSCCFKI